MINKNIGKRIRQYRESADLTQEDLAKALNVSITAVSNIERGVNYPSFENFINIANLFEISADSLLYDVIPHSCAVKATEFADKMRDVSPEKRNRIFAVVDTLLNCD